MRESSAEQTSSGTTADFIDTLSSFSRLHRAQRWEGTFGEFLSNILPGNAAALARSSHEYIWDMLRWHGRAAQPDAPESARARELFKRELFGIDESLSRVVDYFKAAAAGSDVGRRLLLLLGPPSGGKSTLAILIKRGLEEYSRTEEGALYAIRGSPRPARDDRDPEGQARVPVPAAHADAGEERKGIALPADPPRRDDPRAHQPRGVPQVSAGERERGAARSHGDHQDPVRALLPRRVAHLPEAGLRRAGVPQRAPRSARAQSGRGLRHPDPPHQARARGTRPAEEAAPVRGRGDRGDARDRGYAAARRDARRGDDRGEPALRRERHLQRHHPRQHPQSHQHEAAARAQGLDLQHV